MTIQDSRPFTRIEPSRGWRSLGLKELWAYRELVYFFAWRNIKVRYKQTIMGAAWAIIQPVVTMVIFSLFFGRLAQMPSDGLPYPIFNYTALVPWSFFTTVIAQSASSVVGSAGMIKKIYFPRLAVPISSLLSSALDFSLAFAVLLVLMLAYGFAPTLNILYLPLLLLLAIATSLGAGLWLGALNARFRDIQYTIPFLIQVWFFSTPIVYPSSLLPEPWRALFGLNPMAGVVEGFRWALLGAETRPGAMIFVSSLVALALLVSGAYYFRRMEKTFADYM